LYDHPVGADSLGATRDEPEVCPDDDFVVLVIRDGNRFCVVD
jgi:hypothetical protein